MREAVKPAVKAHPARAASGSARFSADREASRRMTVRRWSVRHAALLEIAYRLFASALLRAEPLVRRLGYERAERPVAFVEKGVKGFLFDCRMCGECILSSTGMSCPMTCPKQLRNGPCGGVRADGRCEVIPDMPCVWVMAWKGSRQMEKGDAILEVQRPVDHALRGTSSWLRVMRAGAGARESGA